MIFSFRFAADFFFLVERGTILLGNFSILSFASTYKKLWLKTKERSIVVFMSKTHLSKLFKCEFCLSVGNLSHLMYLI